MALSPVKALGHRSLAAFLRAALRVALIVLWGLAVISGAACLAMILNSYGLDLPGMDAAPRSPALAWLATAIIAVTLTACILIVSRLRRIFVTLADGDPFVPENAGHLQVIWITLAAWELCRYVLGGAAFAVMSLFQAPGPDAGAQFRVELSLSVWFAVLTVIVLAEVFREGARLRQEQKLTI